MSVKLENERTMTDLEMMERKPKRKNSVIYPVHKTKWNLIILAGIVSALNAVENSVIGLGEWPYLKVLDSNADAQFFGFATSASKCGHAIFALVFAIWSYRIGSIKIPLLAGRFIALAACMIYICIEYVPRGRRYISMTVYILLGIANSSSTVLRAYITYLSTNEDRPRAFACIGLSVICSLVMGPMIQLCFSSISYPGYEVFHGVHLHIYSAPIWCSFVLTVVTIVLIQTFMQEVEKDSKTDKFEEDNLMTLEGLKMSIKKLRETNVDWKLITVCLVVKLANSFSHATMHTIMSLFFMVQYGWTGEETVKASSIVMIGFGGVSSIVLILYIFCKLGLIFPQRYTFLFAIILSGFVFIVTYPHKPISTPVVLYNETTKAGCNPAEYSWCETAYAVNPYLFLAVTVLVTSPCLPLLHISLDTLYSKILGNIDQNVAHGAMTVIDDIVFMVTPIFTTTMFVYYGVGTLWIAKATVFFGIAILWSCFLPRIKKYE
ncbi:unnamed protein product [Caenorhabditis bovis]|uniref:Major facilitator superfamily (MFS) profile domain-containing protein n=1 Tax=Caenorhabditis bovis TaxID=2654633 RepID=A0A8S1E9S1_9PELO|nr:unnamed protein product [Caenorhabditis bovis]